MVFRKLIMGLMLLIAFTGCVSNEMKSYLGKDIREVILVTGPPINVMDMGNGSRAFQFMWGGHRSTAVTSTTNFQDESWYGKSRVGSNTNALASSGCVVSYIANWDEVTSSWIVVDYRYPNKIIC